MKTYNSFSMLNYIIRETYYILDITSSDGQMIYENTILSISMPDHWEV